MLRWIAPLVLLFSYLVVADEMADDLTRNQALIAKLTKNPYSRSHELKLLPRGKEQTPLLVSLPLEPLQTYPALYVVLDGSPSGVLATEADHENPYSNAVIVGLASSNRIRDYSSKIPESKKVTASKSELDLEKITPPKGEEFVRHLATEVMPFLEKIYGPFSVKILVGASLGGITTLDTFLSFPQSFDAYAALDPSLWYNHDYYKEKMEALARTPDLLKNKCLLMSGSEDEPELAAAVRKFDRLLAGLDLPPSFIHSYRRLTELTHIQAIRTSNMLVAPFVFGVSDIIPDDDLKGLTVDGFEKKLEKAWRSKTCFSNPTMNELSPLYYSFVASLVAEKRLEDAIAAYDKTKIGSSIRTLTMLSAGSSLGQVFDQLDKSQKDKLAKDYRNAYREALTLIPGQIIHLENREISEYADKLKL